MFNIFKANQIFDHLLKDQQIKLPNGHKIPLSEELKNKKYCKWHLSYNHAIVYYVVFRNAIQKALKEGRFKLADYRIVKMIVDSDLFLSVTTNMISTSSLNFHPKSNKGKQPMKA